MLRLIAIISFVLGVIFLAWNIQHGVWTYKLFELLGLLFWCVSGGEGNWTLPKVTRG